MPCGHAPTGIVVTGVRSRRYTFTTFSVHTVTYAKSPALAPPARVPPPGPAIVT